jgi:uncharacterized protein (TIGR02145 family)
LTVSLISTIMKNKQKNPASLFMILVLVCQLGYSQGYLITFSGSGQSNTVETVEVKNIAQQTMLTLSGTDTLLLTEVVGTGNLPALSQGMSIYPNPANHASRLEFYNSSTGNISIEIYDFSGRLLIHKSILFDAGNHVFTINGLKAGIYLVKVNTPEHIYSRRLVSSSGQNLAPELKYEGIAQSHQQAPGLKSINNIVAMQYNDGERLVFKAISGDYAHTKSLVPTESQHIDFEFMDCIDGDGNQYGVVTIGEPVWMAENLKTTKDAAGNNITRYCYLHNADFCNWYGGLYFQTTIMNGAGSSNNNPSGVQGICPAGWHVPSDAEWTQLVDYVVAQGFPNVSADPNGAGSALKSCRQVNSPLGGECNTAMHPHWASSGLNHGFDAFGFSAIPGGSIFPFGPSQYLGSIGFWWSSTEYSFPAYWYRSMSAGSGKVSRHDDTSPCFSARCLRD